MLWCLLLPLTTALAGRQELHKVGLDQKTVKIIRLFVLLLIALVPGVFPSHLPGRGYRRQVCSHSQNPHWAMVTVTGWLGDSTQLSFSVTHAQRGCKHPRETLTSTHPSTILASVRVSKSTYIFQEEDIESQVLQKALQQKHKYIFLTKLYLTPESYQLQERHIEKLPR